MANEEHLAILKKGVGVWNRWRREYPEVRPDLSGANLSSQNLNGGYLSGPLSIGIDLCASDIRGANLSNAILNDAILSDAILSDAILCNTDLRGAILKGADLSRADLSHAKLSSAQISGANFSGANFSGAKLRATDYPPDDEVIFSHADFRGANLSGQDLHEILLSGHKLNGANLSGANLRNADLSSSSLYGANLRDADLTEADLTETDLRGTDLSSTVLQDAQFNKAILIGLDLGHRNLRGQNFRWARLSSANLSDADLSDADLSNADLNGAILKETSFQTARLINTRLDGANLTDACLWETQRAGWSIKGVICESVYWDQEAEVKTTYNPGDFERLFAEQTRIKLFFKDGVSPLEIATLPALINHLQGEHPGCSLRLVSIHDDAGGAVVELAIEDDDNRSPEQMKQLQAALEAEAQQRIEYQRLALVEREARLQLEGEVRQLDSVVDKLIRHHTINIHQGGRMGDKYDISGQVGAVGPHAHAHDNTFNQIVNHVEQNIDLAELTKQLGELRLAIIQKQDTSPQASVAIGEVAKAELAADEKNIGKVVEHLKTAGKWTLDFATDAGKDLVVAVIKQAMGMP